IENISPIERLLAKLSEGFSSFSTEFNRISVFPSWERARVLWVGCNEEGETKIQQIGRALIQGLRKKGILVEEEREFSPHITLARFRSPLSLSALDWQLNHPFLTVLQKLVLFQSTLTPQGPIYKELFVSHLKG
ncbi:MAG: RNA 2',3'-cyclic phosphodiesterase, partial [Candidatus Caldatribacteriaceae bacterium]